MDVSAYVAPEPAQVVVHVRIESAARNRVLMIEWWSEDGVGGSHLVSLDGERTAIRQDYAITQMTAGEYIVTAVLRRDDGSDVRRNRRVIVVGEGKM